MGPVWGPVRGLDGGLAGAISNLGPVWCTSLRPVGANTPGPACAGAPLWGQSGASLRPSQGWGPTLWPVRASLGLQSGASLGSVRGAILGPAVGGSSGVGGWRRHWRYEGAFDRRHRHSHWCNRLVKGGRLYPNSGASLEHRAATLATCAERLHTLPLPVYVVL